MGKGAVSMWVTWMLVQLRLLPDGEHGANMPSLFQFSVCEFDVFNLELTAKSLSLSPLPGMLGGLELFILKRNVIMVI